MADVQPTSDLYANEQWKPVVGHEGSYEVSDMGRVRSSARTVIMKNGVPRPIKGGIMHGHTNEFGYTVVVLSRIGSRRQYRSHRLVMAAFVGPCPEGMEVCHNNGDPADNRLSNLRYGTSKDNSADMKLHGTVYQEAKTHCPQGHPLEHPNLRASRHGRSCKACHRASARVSKNPNLKDRFQEVSDACLDEIIRTGGVVVPKSACKYGHPLESPNLVPSGLKWGYRTCLACNRAHTYISDHPVLRESMQQISDSYYQDIMRKSA